MDKPGYWPTVCLQKILLPVLLLTACCLRQNGLSSLYLILLFINPFVPVASSSNAKNGGPWHYLILNIIFPSLNLIAQVIFQLVLLSYKVYLDALVPPCNFFESVLRHIGFVSFKGLPVLSMIYLVTPEIILIISSVLIYSCCCFLNRTKPMDDNLLPIVLNANHTSNHDSGNSSRRRFSILTTLGKYVCLFSLCMAGIIQPSLPGLLYFLFFLTCMTWWSYNQNLGRGFAKVCCILPVLLCVHVTSIFVYQTQWAQEYFPEDSPIARYAGLVPLFKVNCTMPAVTEIVSEAPWTEFVNPVILVWLFFIICYETKMLLKPPKKHDGSPEETSVDDVAVLAMEVPTNDNGNITSAESGDETRMNHARSVANAHNVASSATEATPLIRGRESLYRKHGRGKSYIQDSQGSVIVSDEQEDIHRLEDVPEEGESDGGQGILELVLNGMMVIAQLITQSSYIGTNITMMAWSITYHSWMTFVLLLWASAMWMMPNQRRAMLRSSPFLVIYAMILLIIQYIYGMKVREVEIPEEIQGFNMKQIGFEKHPDYPVTPLFIKTMFTMMFWMTLRQYNREKWEASNAAALADMATPLQTGTPSPTEAQTKTSQFIQEIGQYLREFLIKYWIWVVAIFLFFIGISGERMTIFRIVYMALALIFVLTFQLSWMLWRKIMYGFWLTVIIYSMLILVLTYTYQFDYFPEYWDNYLHVNKKLQLDIGLQKFETTELFIRLLTPTFFVIITVIQLYYFHKDFLAISDIKSRGSSSIVRSSATNRSKKRTESRGDEPLSDEAVPEIQSDPVKPAGEGNKGEEKPKKLFSTLGLKKVIIDMWHNIENVIEFGWLFLELHMLSIIMIIIFVLAIYDVCAMHFILIILAVVALAFGTNIRTVFAHIASVVASIFLLAKMVYQIEYISHSDWNVDCDNTSLVTNSTNNKTDPDTLNYAKWLGFGKTTNETTLIDILDGYIVIILVVTLHTVVTTRQKYKRHLKGRSLGRPTTMFSRITYKDIDKDLIHCIKYLINYGFYRFGVEICLMAMVILISLRMDIVAVMYAFWLCIMIRPNRLFLYRVWGLFRLFIALTVPLQYLIVIGLPPGLCFEFSWSSNELWQRAQEWLYLPDPDNPPSAKKIVCDFIVLFLVCRQAVMFSIEKQHEADRFDYAGGTNRSIIDEIDKANFVIPVPDFITYTTTILDVLKQKFMMMFIWFTLIFFFLAGTERVNIFSLGYLIGSFIFFWQGNDLFLLHIKVILRWWKYLIVYNVTVILCKAILQIAGCIFINEILQANSCWFIESFGIGCIKKFRTHFPGDPKACVVPQGDAGLAWDGFCFAFLIMQRRLFNSYYFQHIVNETKAMAILASRGAELIQELSTKQIKEQQEAERKILEKIKYKMDRIKASQQRVQGQGPEYREPANHHVAIRSGDYYMFEDMDEELDLIEEQKSESSDSEAVTDLPSVSKATETREPRPGPSTEGVDYIERDDGRRDGDEKSRDKSDSVSEKEDKQEETKASCLMFMKFLWTLLVSILVSLTNMFNRFSKDYRFIMRILSVEKKLLKETEGFGQGVRAGSSLMWHPRADIVSTKPKLSVESLEDLQTAKDKRNTEKWLIIQFIQSLWFALMSRSELVCYFMIFLNQIKSATLLSLPLPSMVFLWGTLTVPRPSKNFWISVIAYTQTVIVIKCLFQFKILSWDEQAPDNRPFFLPRIIGIERKPNYVTFDLLLLLMVFFHRSVLKSLGLWKTTSEASSQTMLQLNELDSEGNSYRGTSAQKRNIRDRLKRFFNKDASIPATEVSEDLSDSADGSRDRKSMLTIRYPVETPFECLPQIIPLTASKYFNPAKGFFKSLLEPSVRVTADVYAYMFFCDFFNLIVIIFGFAAFGSQQGDGGVAKYIEENRVPIPFLVMLILQFLLIIVDRTLYLRKFILGKIVFQFILVIGIHIWMFFVLPAVTERQFNAALPPQIWYMVKCFYLLLSAYQIRSGYPTRILGNFLCKSYNILNMYLFKLFMLVPFVFEIRALMDWIWTDTSMTLPDWLKMEDIFAHIFQLKCQRRMETEYPQARGEKKTASSKYIYGGGFLFGIFAVLWFPLVWFALGNTVGEPNLPYEVSVSVRIGGYQPIYSMSARNNSIHKLNEQHWENINTVYKRSRKAQTFLSSYSYQDVGVVQFSSHSTSIWTISPPDLGSLIKETQSENPMTIKMDWSALKISTNPEEPSQLNSGTEVVLMPDDPNRQNLVNLLQNKAEGKPMYLKSIFPKFIKVTNRGTINPIQMLMKTEDDGPDGDEFRNVRMDLHRLNATADEPTVMWWVIKEDCNDTIYKDILSKLPYEHTCDNLIMYTFNDKAFPPTFNFISGKGIIGMYTTFVIVVHSFIRGFFTGISFRIMFDDMPYIDRVLQLCRDIYLVRESGELDLEEDLFAKLVFLYRSPETLIKWTRPPDEVPANEEEDIPPLEN